MFIFKLFCQIGSSEKTDPELVILPDGFDKNNVLHIKLDDEGCFNAVKYNGVTLNQGKLTVISLNCKSPAFNFQKFLNDLFNDGWAAWPAMIRLYCKTANLLLFKMCHRIFLKIYLFSVLRICFISYFVM